MLGQPFYHATIRRITVGIGTLFNNVHLVHYDNAGNPVKDVKVPLAYAATSHYMAKLQQFTHHTTENHANLQTSLPRMSFYMTGVAYDSQRQLHPLNIRTAGGTTSSTNRKMFEPVPYTFNFDVNVYVNNIEDGLQIIEQILPTFTPSYTMTIKTIPEMGIVEDIPVVLEGVQMDDNYEQGLETNRMITWSLSYAVKGYLYKPVSEQAIIKQANVSLSDQPSMTSSLESIGVEVVPLTAGPNDPHTVQTTIV